MKSTPIKVRVVSERPWPSLVRELWGYLGLAGYYMRFIQGYEKLARLLTDLLKKNRFDRNAEAEDAFLVL